MKPTEVFFDESGFTGNNLLSRDQPAFVYASVAIDPDQASRLLSEMSRRFRLQGNELKGTNLIGHKRGQEAIYWLLKQCEGISCIAVSNKKLALAGKFYEYIFEPILAPINSFFYAAEFHLFIANLLYVLFEARDKHAEEIMSEFETLMRTKDTSRLEQLLTPLDRGVRLDDPLGKILTFTLCHRQRITQEIQDLAKIEGLSNWVLELTTTSLFWLLSFWGERFGVLEVYCDKSKPIEINRQLFDAMIGRKDRIYMKLGRSKEVALTYNLSAPVVLTDSIQSPGIQMADILASSVAYAFKNPDDGPSKQLLYLAKDMLGGPCILPDVKTLDLRAKGPFINSLILHELVDRTIRGASLLVDWEEFLVVSTHAYERLYSTGSL
ncbi:MAG: DUF3800 domain-containing protein [Chloroflexi bacterium]|nr:DUF3800 domain-containing protein [Chloroflexota bacterium]